MKTTLEQDIADILIDLDRHNDLPQDGTGQQIKELIRYFMDDMENRKPDRESETAVFMIFDAVIKHVNWSQVAKEIGRFCESRD